MSKQLEWVRVGRVHTNCQMATTEKSDESIHKKHEYIVYDKREINAVRHAGGCFLAQRESHSKQPLQGGSYSGEGLPYPQFRVIIGITLRNGAYGFWGHR